MQWSVLTLLILHLTVPLLLTLLNQDTAPNRTVTADLTKTAPDKCDTTELTKVATDKTAITDMSKTAPDKTFTADLTETVNDKVITTDQTETDTADLTDTVSYKTVTNLNEPVLLTQLWLKKKLHVTGDTLLSTKLSLQTSQKLLDFPIQRLLLHTFAWLARSPA